MTAETEIDQPAIPLSFVQEEVWRNDQLSPGDTSYNLYHVLCLTGTLEGEVLQRSLDGVMQRHAILRTYFTQENGKPVQKVVGKLSVTLRSVDLSHLTKTQQDDEIDRCLKHEENFPYDLKSAPLWRVRLLNLGNQSYLLVLGFHHIINDASSIEIFVQELVTLYSAFLDNKPSPLKPLSMQYADFASWQKQYYTPEIIQKRYDYWQSLLASPPPRLRLPTDESSDAISEKRKVYQSGVEVFEIPADIIQNLRQLGNEQGSTLSITLLSVYVAMLYHYSGQHEITVGLPTNKRNHWKRKKPEIVNLFGYFSGMSILHIQLDEEPTFLQILRQVQFSVLRALKNQDLTLKQVWNSLQLPWTGEHQLLFRTVFNFIPLTGGGKEISISNDLHLRMLSFKRKKMVRDLVIGVWDSDGSGAKFDGYFRYRKDLFKREKILEMIKTYQSLLVFLSKKPQQIISVL